MSTFFRNAVLLVTTLLLPLAIYAATPFEQAESDLKPDPAIHFGTLPNGMRYAIRANHEPKSRASMRLLVEAGSLNETPDQRGLAHFLEHMAFNGSEHYAPSTLVEFFQRMGMSFGGDTNASTSFERTLYLLELPDTKPATMAEGLRVFADYGGGLLLPEPQIAKERGIILSEKRTRDSVSYRTFVSQFDFLLKGTRFPERMPIGETNIIEQAGRDRFADFYNKWYRPELMSVIIVGDFDVSAVEKQLVDAMSPLKARTPAPPPVDLGKIATAPGTYYSYHADPEAPSTTVTITSVTPYSHEPDTAANRLKYLPRDIATSIINLRLSILAKQEGSPFRSASMNVAEEFNFFRQAGLDLTCTADQWQAALAVGDQELRRALQYGFQPAELKEAVDNFTNALQEGVKTASTRRSPELADEIAESILQKIVVTSPAQDLALFGPALKKLTVEDCLAALRTAWAPARREILVAGNLSIPGDAPAAIASAYSKAEAIPVSAPVAVAGSAWSYINFGQPGTVTKREHIDDLDITLLTFANGVRLNLKKTDFQANQIHVNVRLGEGKLIEPRDKSGLSEFTSSTFTAGGLGKHSADDLRRMLAGKTVSAGFSVGGDAFTFHGSTNREDLGLEMQLIAAYITDPGYRPEAARQARKGLDSMYLSLAHTLGGPLTLEVQRLLANGDPRFGLPPELEMDRLKLDDEKAWLAPQLHSGPIEVAIVGDFDIDATIAAVGATLGALPPREPKPKLEELRHVTFPSTPFAKQYHIATQIPKGLLAFYWPTSDAQDIHRVRRLNLLAEILTDRLRVQVREKLGGAYSPAAGSQPSDVYPNYGFMIANVTVDPAKAEEIGAAVEALAADLAEHGVTPDELERAKLPLMTSIRESARTNEYWMATVVNRAQEKPEVLGWSRTRISEYEGLTKADLDAVARQYLAPGRDFRVVVLPEKPSPGLGKSTAEEKPATN